VDGGVSRLFFKNDLNTTRIASRHKMLKWVLKLSRALQALAAKETAEGKPPSWEMSAETLLQLSEMEAVLEVTAEVTTTRAGSPCYKSPKQDNFNDMVTGSADMWAVGLMLLEAILNPNTDRYSVPETDVQQNAMRIIQDNRCNTISNIAEIGLQCMHKDPKARITAPQVLHLMKKLLKGVVCTLIQLNDFFVCC
jgi:serine/threonine protein kinase